MVTSLVASHYSIYIYICHRHKIWDKEKMMWFVLVIVIANIGGDAQQMCRQIMAFPLHMCSSFPTEKAEQTIMTSFYDVTMNSCATGEGSI